MPQIEQKYQKYIPRLFQELGGLKRSCICAQLHGEKYDYVVCLDYTQPSAHPRWEEEILHGKYDNDPPKHMI